jgi:hypothetical protein
MRHKREAWKKQLMFPAQVILVSCLSGVWLWPVKEYKECFLLYPAAALGQSLSAPVLPFSAILEMILAVFLNYPGLDLVKC